MVMRHRSGRLGVLRATFPRRWTRAVRALIAVGMAAALSSCGGSGTTSSQAPPLPNGPWPGRDVVYFLEACESSGIDVNTVDSYCTCALKEEMHRDPKPNPDTPAVAGAAAGYQHGFPGCARK